MTTYKEINEKLDKLVTGVGEIVVAQGVMSEQLKQTCELSGKHNNALYGDNGDVGLIGKHDTLSKKFDSIEKALWVIVTPVLALIGIGIIIAAVSQIGK